MAEGRKQCVCIKGAESSWIDVTSCDHPIPALTDNCSRPVQLADTPEPQSAAVTPNTRLLLISSPAEDRRLSWPEHTAVGEVSDLLKVACSGSGECVEPATVYFRANVGSRAA